mmetsp:Transcript_118870/g.341400  ORF Transcript_118870/g.341400 Transcript_118870/m.341400 type:complete len:297 (+) Transcript_118870:99-989(+)
MARSIMALALVAALGAWAAPQVHREARGGKIKIYDSSFGEHNRVAGVTAYFDSLKEVDEDGQTVSIEGHSFPTFAVISFQPEAPLMDYALGTAKATALMSKATLTGVGKVHGDSFLITEAGMAGNSEESWEVIPGDVQWRLGISEWAFCDPCFLIDGTNESSAYLDLVVVIQGFTRFARVVQENGEVIGADLEEGVNVTFAQKVDIDGQLHDLPAGYPKAMTSSGNRVYVTVRIPKFSTGAHYDVLIAGAVSPAANNTDSDGRGGAGGIIVGVAPPKPWPFASLALIIFVSLNPFF